MRIYIAVYLHCQTNINLKKQKIMKTFKTITSKPEAKIGLSLFFFTLLLAFTFIAEFKNTFEYIAMFLIFVLPFIIVSIFFIVLAIKETINGNK